MIPPLADGAGDSYPMRPIGHVRSPLRARADAARQPAAAREVRGRIELLPDGAFLHATEGISTWSHLWVIFVFHLNEGWKAKVAPPRSEQKLGVFATRAPYRPNPIGLSLVRLERVEGHMLHVRELDILDGSPVLDLKPYVAYADSAADASDGWLQERSDPGDHCEVVFEAQADSQLRFLEARGCHALRGRAVEQLSLGGAPHPYRRIRADGDAMRIAIQDFRLRFVRRDATIHVLSVHSGYRRKYLARPDAAPRAEVPLAVHREFLEAFG